MHAGNHNVAHSCFDIQINGCFGVDFNADDLTVEQLVQACQKLRAGGTEKILATLITDDVPLMLDRIRRLVAFRLKHDVIAETIIGIHVEGPFINPREGYGGAHPAEFARPANLDVAKQLFDAGQGWLRMVTLAPEQDPTGAVVRWLVDQGVVVSAGHTDASLDQLRRALDQGLSLFTHLGNGCPRWLHRHDNIIQRVFNVRDRLLCTMIGDGEHVPFWFLQNVVMVFGADRTIMISDATAAAGMEAGKYTLGRQVIARSASGAGCQSDLSQGLAGSATLLPEVADKLRTQVKMAKEEIDRMTSGNARQVFSV